MLGCCFGRNCPNSRKVVKAKICEFCSKSQGCFPLFIYCNLSRKAEFSKENIKHTLDGKQVWLYSKTVTVGIDYNVKIPRYGGTTQFEELVGYMNINIC